MLAATVITHVIYQTVVRIIRNPPSDTSSYTNKHIFKVFNNGSGMQMCRVHKMQNKREYMHQAKYK